MINKNSVIVILLTIINYGFFHSAVNPQSSANIRFNLENMQFDALFPGAYWTVDQDINPDDSTTQLNYFLQMDLWVGVKQGDTLSVVSGDGNPAIPELPEWRFITNIYEIEDLSADTSVVAVYRSVYDDQISLPGHTPVGLIVNQRTYEYKHVPALIFEYRISSMTNIDSISVGMFFDFDIPENNNTSNPYNDQVFVDTSKSAIFMSNNGNWRNSSTPAVLMLSENHFNYKVFGSLSKRFTDNKKWEILKGPGNYKYKTDYTAPDDYRFIVYSDVYTLRSGDTLTFSVALVHAFGYDLSNNIINNLRLWYQSHPILFRSFTQNNPKNTVIPDVLTISPGFPNPFNSTTMFSISLPEKSEIAVNIYNLSGRIVKSIHRGILDSGIHYFEWQGKNQNGRDVGSGIYFIQLKGSGIYKTQKIVLLR